MNKNIVEAFGKIYFASWLLDFSKGRLFEVSAPKYVKSIAELGNSGLESAIASLIGHIASNESADSMKEFLNTETLSERMEGKDHISCEYKSSDHVWCQANLIPVGEDKYILALRRIEEEKKKEDEIKAELEQANEAAHNANIAKSKFYLNVSHDVRTPLNGIIGMTNIALKNIDNKENVIECLNKILISCNNLIELLNEISDIRKVEEDQIELHNEDFDLRAVIDKTILNMKPEMEKKHQEFICSTDDICHADVIGDDQRVQQILTHLLSNANKYTPEEGKISLSVKETSVIEDQIGCYEFVIEDNGIGMSEEFLEHIYEPFSRADDDRVNSVLGTGVGMSIVQSIVQKLDGTIHVESKPDQGTKVTVTICLVLQVQKDLLDELNAMLDTAEQDNHTEAIKESGHKINGNRRLLVAEDYNMNWEILKALLPAQGFILDPAVDGQVCVDKFLSSEVGYYDAVLMDLRMPVKDGYQAAREIRTSGREDSSIPIIAMSADAFTEDIKACKKAGMDEHIAKPLDMKKLVALLDQLTGMN